MIKAGFIAEFVTAYLQRELILHQATVAGGIDTSVYNSANTGYSVGRLVKVTKSADNTYTIIAPTTGVGSIVANTNLDDWNTKVTAGIGDATHIIAESDNAIREVPEDAIPTEKYTTRYDGYVKNSNTDKTVAVYKIVNADDIKLVQIGTTPTA